MKVVNLIWGFGIGGISKCYETYATLGSEDSRLEMHNVCIYLNGLSGNHEILEKMGAYIIEANGRFDIRWVKRLVRVINGIRPDCVFAHGFNAPVVYLIARLFGARRVPLLCSYHGAYHPSTRAKRLVAPLYNSAMHLTHRFFAQSVLTCAFYCKDYLVAHGVPAEKVEVVHNGVPDTPHVCPVSKFDAERRWINGRMVVGVASRIDIVKGIDVLLRALALLKAEGCSDICLLLVGDGADMQKLQTLASELRLEDDVKFVGGRTDVRDWLSLMDIFALPSRFECHSIGLLEAMRDGKSIVCTNVGGNCESVREGTDGLVVPPDDEIALARAIDRLAEDGNLRRQLGESARARFKSCFTEEKMSTGIANWLVNLGARHV